MTARTRGAHHVGLTVPDVEAARRFFVEALGFDTVGGRPDYPAAFVSDGTLMITLWRAADPDTATPFDRRANLGLHHLALRVGDGVGAGMDASHRGGPAGFVESMTALSINAGVDADRIVAESF